MSYEGFSSLNREVLLSYGVHQKGWSLALPIRRPVCSGRLIGLTQHKAQWSGTQKVQTAQGTKNNTCFGGGRGKNPQSNSGFADPKGSYSILSQIRGVRHSLSSSRSWPKASTSSMLSPPSTAAFFFPPKSSQGSRRVDGVGLCSYYVFNSGGNPRTTSNLACGSFHCWLHPRYVYARMHLREKDTQNAPQKRQFVLRWKKSKTNQPCFPSGIWPAHGRFGGRRQKRKKTAGGTHLSYPLSPLFQGVLHILLKAAPGVPQVFSRCVRWAENRSHSELLHQRFHRGLSQKSEERTGGRRQPRPGPFYSARSFFFLLLFNPLHGSQSP